MTAHLAAMQLFLFQRHRLCRFYLTISQMLGRKIKIGSLNANSLKATRRLRDLLVFGRTMEIDILVVVDSRLPTDITDKLVKANPLIGALTNYNGSAAGGITIFFNKRSVSITEPQKLLRDREGRFLAASLEVGMEQPITVAGIYPPAQEQARMGWYNETLSQWTTENAACPPIDLYCGDWNAIEESIDRKAIRARSVQDRDKIQSLFEATGILGMNYVDGWRMRNPGVVAWTSRQRSGAARIDRIYIREDWLNRTEDWEHCMVAPLETDHQAVTVSISDSGPPRGTGRWRLNPASLKSSRIRRICHKILEKYKTEWETTECTDILSKWIACKDEVQETLKPVITVNKRNLQKKRQKLERRRRGLQRKRIHGQFNQQLEDRIHLAQTHMENLENWAAASYSYNSLAKQMLLGERPTKYFFNRMKARDIGTPVGCLRDDNGEEHSDPEGMLRVMEQFYGDLYDTKQISREEMERFLSHMDARITKRESRKLRKPISVKEVSGAIRRGTVGTAPGMDGLPYEYYKTLMGKPRKRDTTESSKTPLIVRALVRLFCEIQKDTSQGLEKFSEGVLSVLYKKGDPKNIRNYRPLTVLNVDYKLLTEILMRRLLGVLQRVIGDHQSAFLNGRVIDDNVRLVQGTIDYFQKIGGHVVFLDQEKAYDRVSHDYLWAVMKQIGIPKRFVKVLQNLYRRAYITPYLNGTKGNQIMVLCGVRQGDPISCPLYLVAIEPLAQTLIKDTRIVGLTLPGGKRVVVIMYADDTAVFPRCDNDAIIIFNKLNCFEIASGAKLNWSKSVAMKIGEAPPLTTANIQIIQKGQSYRHLGIPVGVDIDDDIKSFWKDMVLRLGEIVDLWLKCHLSLRGRVLVGNSLLLSVPRYAFRFLRLPGDTLQEIERLYYRLIWDGKERGYIERACTLRPTTEGGLKCQDIQAIVDASVIAFFARMEKYPNLPWVKIQTELLKESPSRTIRIHRNRVECPWRQRLAVRAPTAPALTKHIWERWVKLIGYANPSRTGPLRYHDPSTVLEVLSENIWYNPLFEVKRGQGASVYTRYPGWKLLADLDPGPRVLKDIWDSEHMRPREFPSLNPNENRLVKKAILELWQLIPETWKRIVDHQSHDEDILIPRQPLMLSLSGSNIPLEKLSYTIIYRGLVQAKLEKLDETSTIEAPRRAVAALLGRTVTSSEMWGATRDFEKLPKAGDLLWRLLHEKVYTGDQLHWLPVDKRTCILDGQTQSIQHIWIDCEAARGVWDLFRTVWHKIQGVDPVLPTSTETLIGLLAVSPSTEKYERIRWKILYSTAVWSIWNAYLQDNFEETVLYRDRVVSLYRNAILGRFQVDRIACTSSRYRSQRHAKTVFRRVWGQDPKGIGALTIPDYLKGPETS